MAKGLRLLFLSYWSAEEPLVRSTILPYLKLMSEGSLIDQVWLVTVERGGDPSLPGISSMEGVHHVTVNMRWKGRGILSKIDLFIRLFLVMVRLVRKHDVQVIDSKAALAGGMAYLVHRFTGVPFIVESFEPHSDYMADTGTWSRKGLYYRLSDWLERKQLSHARFLVTVTNNFARDLLQAGYSQRRVRVIPSITDLDQFRFDPKARQEVRAELGWTNAVVGVYVGKFGGLYFDKESYQFFKIAHQVFGDRFRLVLLTKEPREVIDAGLREVDLDPGNVIVRFEEHHRVPRWLSAADFGYSLVRPSPSSPYMSPVKNGEYWAAGLPVLICDGVADDHLIVKERPECGSVFDPQSASSVEAGFKHLQDLMNLSGTRDACMQVAREYRGLHIARRIYDDMFGTLLAETQRK